MEKTELIIELTEALEAYDKFSKANDDWRDDDEPTFDFVQKARQLINISKADEYRTGFKPGMIEEIILPDAREYDRDKDLLLGLELNGFSINTTHSKVGLKLSDILKDTGILVYYGVPEWGVYDPRIVIENVEGKLMLHVWSTIESLGNDPTHSIEIESHEFYGFVE